MPTLMLAATVGLMPPAAAFLGGTNPAVYWSASKVRAPAFGAAGSLDAGGYCTAPDEPGTYRIVGKGGGSLGSTVTGYGTVTVVNPKAPLTLEEVLALCGATSSFGQPCDVRKMYHSARESLRLSQPRRPIGFHHTHLKLLAALGLAVLTAVAIVRAPRGIANQPAGLRFKWS